MIGKSKRKIAVALPAKRQRIANSNNPCLVCGKLSKTSTVVARPWSHPETSSARPSNVSVCEACKKFCSRFSARLADEATPSLEKEEWRERCGCRELAQSPKSESLCRWCRFRRCHSLGLVVDNELKKSLKAPIDIHSVPCVVCQAPSSGYHFGIISCEGCKGFFRRTNFYALADSYSCDTGEEDCDVTSREGRKCKFCRYSKCVSLGMSLKAVRTGRHSYQLRAETQAHIAQLRNGVNDDDNKLIPMLRIFEDTPSPSNEDFVSPTCSSMPSPIDLEIPFSDSLPDELCDADDDGGDNDAGRDDPDNEDMLSVQVTDYGLTSRSHERMPCFLTNIDSFENSNSSSIGLSPQDIFRELSPEISLADPWLSDLKEFTSVLSTPANALFNNSA